VIVLALAMGLNSVAVAAPDDPKMTSTGYSVIESEEGATGRCAGASDLNQCLEQASANYNFTPTSDDGGSTLGQAIGGGSSSSAGYSSGETSGFNTTGQPSLTMVVNTGSIDLGVLSTTIAKTATATFSVQNYTSNKYVVQIIGATPVYAGHNLTAMTGNAGIGGDASSAGTEQFGLNLVLNTGIAGSANPACAVSGWCAGVAGDGTASLTYKTADKYRFVSGETVASGPSSSSQTDYTITFLANQSTSTPAGKYSGNLAIVATGTY
jgi:hypothetical protein